MKALVIVLSLFALICTVSVGQELTTCAEINAVDEDGLPTFPGLQTMNRYTIEGIVLNDPFVFNSETTESVIMFVQDETGGIQVFSGSFYGGGKAVYGGVNVRQGDRVRVTGLTGFYGGKTNMNDRHNKDNTFDIEVLGAVGDPAPFVIEDLSAATEFDASRASGGEYYQGRLVRLKNVKIVGGEWVPHGMVVVEDVIGGQINVKLCFGTHIADEIPPDGVFDLVGIFNQEDTTAPHDSMYEVWPRSYEDFKVGSAVIDWMHLH
jgi:hypothetical protein